MPQQNAIGRLGLEDGTVYQGRAFGVGAGGEAVTVEAEVVFNTAMTGYQESLTDPSYAGQILVETAPLIGNTGVNRADVESERVQVAGFVVRELAQLHSNYRATGDLSSYLADQGVLGITGVDTRAITRRLRTTGALRGVLTADEAIGDAELVERARRAASMAGQNLVAGVGCSSDHGWEDSLGSWATLGTARPDGQLRVLAIDCGAKRNILRNLTERGCAVTIIPHKASAADIVARFERGEADGLFVSNGPGDPAAVEATIAMLREIISGDRTIPTFGICLGHQLLSLAVGAETYKLKFGHRGANQPVRNLLTGRVEITSQNHGFAVTRESVEAAGGEVTHVNLNDDTVAGFRLRDRPVFAVQHHPEASPGPHDAGYLFDAFVSMMKSSEPVTAEAMGGVV
ncbi:MAG: glutamine-hydrolyzing carbamoyl-phosphate synthase small subunit [Planctomycetota bacterium]